MDDGARRIITVVAIALGLIIGLPFVWGLVSGGSGWGAWGPGMMGGGLGMGFGGLFMVLFWGLIIWAIVGAVQGASRPGSQGDAGRDSALEMLKRRYARGDIGKEEYEAKKKDLA